MLVHFIAVLMVCRPTVVDAWLNGAAIGDSLSRVLTAPQLPEYFAPLPLVIRNLEGVRVEQETVRSELIERANEITAWIKQVVYPYPLEAVRTHMRRAALLSPQAPP
jgi:hypothetical protein